MGQRKQVKRLNLDLDESQSSALSETACIFEDAENTFDAMIYHSEELFNAEIQEYILEREHLLNYGCQVAYSVLPDQLEMRKGLSIFEFNRVTSLYERECIQS